MSFQFELGQEVKDRITGFKGTIISRIEYITGCIQYGVKPRVDKDGKIIDAEYIDETQIELIGKKPKSQSEGPSGGIMSDRPKF